APPATPPGWQHRSGPAGPRACGDRGSPENLLAKTANAVGAGESDGVGADQPHRGGDAGGGLRSDRGWRCTDHGRLGCHRHEARRDGKRPQHGLRRHYRGAVHRGSPSSIASRPVTTAARPPRNQRNGPPAERSWPWVVAAMAANIPAKLVTITATPKIGRA